MTKLSAKDVVQRIDEAAHTLQKLPRFRIQGFISSWPAVVRDASLAYGYGEVSASVGPPPSNKIDEMDEVMRWLLWLDHYETKLVWLRANNARWKTIAHRLNFCESKLRSDWKVAIYTITFALANGTPISARQPEFVKSPFTQTVFKPCHPLAATASTSTPPSPTK